MQKFGLMNYNYGAYNYMSGINFGDEIQSIAASFFIPQIDYFIDRERLQSFQSDSRVKLIINGWFMHDHKEWPPSVSIEPLIISFHLARDKEKFCKKFLDIEREYVIKHGPIGTRDIATMEILQENNIPSYYSGCLSLTLPKFEDIKKGDYILLVDVEEKIRNRIINETDRPVISVSPCIPNSCFFKSAEDKFLYAIQYLKVYQAAHAVVTSRFHCAMPCLALGTPVVLLKKPDAKDVRFTGIDKIVRWTDTDYYYYNYDYFNVNYPEPNSEAFKELRDKMISICEKFTGFKQSKCSPLLKWQSREEYDAKLISAMCDYAKNTDICSYKKFVLKRKKQQLQRSF